MMKKKNLKVVSLTANDIITMSRDQAFAYFLGLLEGDGTFYFGPVNSKYISVGGIEKKYCSLAFDITIDLSNDSDLFNEAMLYNLNEKLELKGFINVGKRRNRHYNASSENFKQRRAFLPYVQLCISNKNAVLNLLELINFWGGLFLTKRRSQYILFESVFKRYHVKPRISMTERAELVKEARVLKSVKWSNPDLSAVDVKKYGFSVLVPHQVDYYLDHPFFDWWLVGFTEAEGSFCIQKPFVHNFNISQVNEEVICLAIKNYFKITTAVSKDNINCYKLSATSFNNMKTILTFFKGKLLGQKFVSYEHVKQSWENKHSELL
jgi:hypothetical protein